MTRSRPAPQQGDEVQHSILLVEDDADLREMVRRALVREGFDVTGRATGGDALRAVEHDVPDAIVLDIGLPDSDGRDVCEAIRSRGVKSPVLFLTARDAVSDRIAGFGAGGDDYVMKPFELKELVARLGALLSRSAPDPGLVARGLRLDPVAHAGQSGDTRVNLTPTEVRPPADGVPPPRGARGAARRGAGAARPARGRVAHRRRRPRQHARRAPGTPT